MKHSEQSFDAKILALCGPLMKSGKWGEVVSLLEQVVARGSADPEVLGLLARGYEEKGRIEDALVAYKALCSAYPGECDSAQRYCALLLRSGKRERALRVGVEQFYASPQREGCAGLLRTVEKLLPPDAPVQLPEFLGIGAMKAATSWLHVCLSLHPEVFVPEAKELHHFDTALASNLRLYSEMFRGRAEKVRGEITPGYSTLNDGYVKRLHQLRPDMKILLLLRNPIDRAWSHARMNLAAQQGRAPEDVPVSEYLAHFQSEASRKRGDYPTIIKRWGAVFGDSQFFIGFHEEVENSPQRLLEDVFCFLGVRSDLPPQIFPLGRRVHQGRSLNMPRECREELRDLYAPILGELGNMFGEKVNNWLK